MTVPRGLEARMRRWAWSGAFLLGSALVLCLIVLLGAWRRQLATTRAEVDDYTRAEGLAVARLLLYDLASDERVWRIHLLESNLATMGGLLPPGESPPPSALQALVGENLELPDTQIWMIAKKRGWTVPLESITVCRRTLYREKMAALGGSLEEDLAARVTFSDHLRGLGLVSQGGLAVIRVGEGARAVHSSVAGGDVPPAARILSPDRMAVTLPLFVHSRRWGRATLILDRAPLERMGARLGDTLAWGLWSLAALFVVILGAWSLWWGFALRTLRRDVVRPVVGLARRMEAWAQENPPEPPAGDEPRWLAEAFDRLLVRVELQREQLLRAQRLGLMEKMGAGLSHELNNALNPAILRLDELLMEGRAADKEDLGALRVYLSSAQKVLKELSLMGRSRDEASTPLAPSHWLAAARKLVEPPFKKGSVALSWEVAEDGPTVLGQEQPLIQLAVNVLLNALDAARPPLGGGHVRVALEERGGEAVLVVEDDGPGIPPEVAGREFEPFVTTKAQGTGLGLYAVEVFLRRMGGSVTLAPRSPRGTKAEIRLPASSPGEEEER